MKKSITIKIIISAVIIAVVLFALYLFNKNTNKLNGLQNDLGNSNNPVKEQSSSTKNTSENSTTTYKWASLSELKLCWDGDPTNTWNNLNQGSPSCSTRNGWIDLDGAPLGAVEFCKHITNDGSIVANIGTWKLPTKDQMIAALNSQFGPGRKSSGFLSADTMYWAGTEDAGYIAWYITGVGANSLSITDEDKGGEYSVVCVSE